ncbi:MAG: thiamine pyrophosphate-requiring protein [Beijerinckiaceae bacterium]|nr:thiamine pyrophosphate-requiring protein [Beijerinckiaceae bacterium]
MNIQTPAGPTVAQSYMSALKSCGIRHVLANGGTDFAPIIEGILQNWQAGGEMPEFVTVPHENVAVAMAQGYYKASGDMAGVMVHVNVGTANTICALMNAARDNTPILLAAGRTPLTETGHAGSRDVPIHWAQENFDQAAIVREHVKWEYELRDGQPINTLVARAVDIAMSEPRGPVYLTLPREVLGNPSKNPGPLPRGRAFGAVPAIPDIEALERAADMIAAAQNPIIVMTSAANAATFKALGAFAKAHAIAVLTGPHAALSSSNPMNLGLVNGPALKAADLIIVLNSAVPWVPHAVEPSKDARLIHIATDPHFATYPFRGFEMDLAIAGDPAAALTMLGDMLSTKLKGREVATDRRRKLNTEKRQALLESRKAAIEAASTQSPISYAWAAHCVNELKGSNATVVEELGVPFAFLDVEDHRDFMATSSGALGMGLGMGLGAKCAAPDRTIITTVGDGSYMFGCPTAAHFVSQAENLPVLTMVMNNSQWFAVRRATVSMYPDGLAAKANSLPIVDLSPSPDYHKIAEAFGGYGEKVDDPAKLKGAIGRALDQVAQGRQATLNVVSRTRAG